MHIYFHQLNGRKRLVVFSEASSEGLQLYSLILNLTISNRTLNAIFSNAFFVLKAPFTAVMDKVF
jgi:hypothetical protein